MFGMSFVELSIVAVLALLLLGPDQLPGVARTLGKTLRELRRATDDLKQTFETEMVKLDAEVKQQPTRPAPPRAPSMGAAQTVLETTAVSSVETLPAPAAPLPLDQVRRSAPPPAPPLDPAAMRARARANAGPLDPGSARAAARMAAVEGAAQASSPAPQAGPVADINGDIKLDTNSNPQSDAPPADPTDTFTPLRTANAAPTMSSPSGAPEATIPRVRKPDPS